MTNATRCLAHSAIATDLRITEVNLLNACLMEEVNEATRWVRCGTYQLTDFGQLGPAFVNADVEVMFGTDADEKILVLRYDYRWTHPSGSNGYTVRKEINL